MSYIKWLAVSVVAMCAIPCQADNIYVGSGESIVKYDSAGNRTVFADSDIPNGLAFDKGGNLYVANGIYAFGYISKYDSSGNVTFPGSKMTGPKGIALDSAGNLYVANNSGGPAYSSWIEKVDTAGNSSLFATIPGSVSRANGLAFDKNDNLYVASVSTTSAFNGILKIDPSGTISSFLSDNWDWPFGLAIDSAGTLVCTNDSVIYKVSSSGEKENFTYQFNLPDWYPQGCAFDSHDNLYVSYINFNAGLEGLIVEFDQSGNQIWSASLGGDGTGGSFIATQSPEPASMTLLAIGAAAILRRRSRQVSRRSA